MRGVAVPYVIALILGVAVIGLVGFWFASSGGKFSGQSSKTICNNKFLQWCITNPGGGTYTAFATSNTECTGMGSYSDCNELTGSAVGGSVLPPGGGGGTNCDTITPTKNPANCDRCLDGITLCDGNCNGCQTVEHRTWSCRGTPNKCALG